jgi:glycosyltransferase involved in cell wall biosynthesis
MLPTLSVIIPSYNQAKYLEETLLSILDQHYPGLELIVIDGGSTDGSIDIIKKFKDKIAYWVSEPDRGQSHAINKGFEKATGEWVAWMNSDDCYLPDTLVKFFTETDHHCYDFMHGLCTAGKTMATRGYRQINRNHKQTAFDVLLFFLGTEYIIPSQSVFVRRSILNKVGPLREDLHYVMDMEWFARIYLATTANRRYFYNYAICFFRKQPLAKTNLEGGNKMYWEARKVAAEMAHHFSPLKQNHLLKLIKTDTDFKADFSSWKSFFQWIKMAFQYPLQFRYYKAAWARGKQLLPGA